MVGSTKLLDTRTRRFVSRPFELDRKRLQVAQALGASGLIEVPTFGPNKFQDLSPIMTNREIEDRLLVAGLRELIPDVQRTSVKLMIEASTTCNWRRKISRRPSPTTENTRPMFTSLTAWPAPS